MNTPAQFHRDEKHCSLSIVLTIYLGMQPRVYAASPNPTDKEVMIQRHPDGRPDAYDVRCQEIEVVTIGQIEVNRKEKRGRSEDRTEPSCR